MIVRAINRSCWFIVDTVKCPTRVCREGTMFRKLFLGKCLLIVSQLRDKLYLELWTKYMLLLCKITEQSFSYTNRRN